MNILIFVDTRRHGETINVAFDDESDEECKIINILKDI